MKTNFGYFAAIEESDRYYSLQKPVRCIWVREKVSPQALPSKSSKLRNK